MSNKRAVETLGISHGAAASRLRKMVLFRQLKKYGDNICVRCGLEITDIDELSIEHLQPWEGRSAELFWDLNNVGFSHMACNLADRHTRPAVKLRKIGPSGTSWCVVCKLFKSAESFSAGDRWNGLDSNCRDCKNTRNALRDRRQVSVAPN